MPTWKITNSDKKNAVERQFWTRDGQTVVREDCFRWGTWTCESDTKPDIDLVNESGFEVWSGDGYDWQMEEMVDGCWTEITYPDDMPEEEREKWNDAWEENSEEGVELLGWVLDENEYWIYGPIELTNLDTGKTYP